MRPAPFQRLIHRTPLKSYNNVFVNTLRVQSRCYSTNNKDDDVTNVAILGGGITGLASAFFLARSNPKAKITIFESGSRLGSWLRSTKIDVGDGHVVFEGGPRTLRPNGPAALVTLTLVR